MHLPLSYHWRNLLVRRVSTTLTFVVVGVVVFVLAVLLSFAAGMRQSLAAAGSLTNVIVLAKGASSESTSILLTEEAARIDQTPGVARNSEGRPLVSRNVYVQTPIPRTGGDKTPALVPIRGVDDIAYDVHPVVTLAEGRKFQQGAQELIVGREAQSRYANLKIGDKLALGRLGNREFEIVGVFDAERGALESELWGPRTILQDVYNRTVISSSILRLRSAADIPAALDYLAGPTVALDAKGELEYYDELASKTKDIIVLTTALIGIMGIGAAFAVANTMYAAVDGRRREIAMLRTLGFTRTALLFSFVAESVLICTPASLTALAAGLLLNGRKTDFFSDTTYTVLAYELRLTPGIFVSALVTALLVGVVGAILPALRASRIPVLEALRKA